jgi:steroid delta-isomerase-like uncharacterized protein
MSPKEIVEKQIRVAIGGDWSELRTLYADGVHYRDPDGEFDGADQAVEHLQQQMTAFPDEADLSIRRIYEIGDEAAIAEWTATMRNTGPLRLPDGTELPATGNEVTIETVTIYDIANGVITSERNYWDNAALLAQLGLLPE